MGSSTIVPDTRVSLTTDPSTSTNTLLDDASAGRGYVTGCKKSATGPNLLETHDVSDATAPGILHDGVTVDYASSATLHDEFPWHIQADPGGSKQRLPTTITPALLQTSLEDLSPSSRDVTDDEVLEPEKSLSEPPQQEDDVPSIAQSLDRRYSTAPDDHWAVWRRNGIMMVNPLAGSRAASHDFTFYGQYNHISDWVAHTTPILQHYANRQTSLPLGRRLEISLDEPSNFLTGGLQLLVNRDHPKNSETDGSRHLGPQLLENFVDIQRWATEYFRSRHEMQTFGSDVPILLTVITNQFYEAHIQLIDRVVDFAIEHMRFCGRATLDLEDFAFGFDLRMSQDLPFYVETSSRIRDALPTYRAPSASADTSATIEPSSTKSARRAKATKQVLPTAEEGTEKSPLQKQKQKNVENPSTTSDNHGQSPKSPATRRRGRKKNASQDSKSPSGEVLRTQSASVYHTPNHGLARNDLSPGTECPTCGQVVPSTDNTTQRSQASMLLQPETGPKVPNPYSLSTSQYAAYRPILPSSLGLPPMMPALSPTMITPEPSNSHATSNPGAAVPESLETSNASSGAPASSRLKIILPASGGTSMPTAFPGNSGQASNASDTSTLITAPQGQGVPSQDGALINTRTGRGGAPRARGTTQRSRGRGRGRGRGASPNTTSSTMNHLPSALEPEAQANQPIGSSQPGGIERATVARSTFMDALLRAGGGSTGSTVIQPYGSHIPSVSVDQAARIRTGESPSSSDGDPHQGKKRKLDDSGDRVSGI